MSVFRRPSSLDFLVKILMRIVGKRIYNSIDTIVSYKSKKSVEWYLRLPRMKNFFAIKSKDYL